MIINTGIVEYSHWKQIIHNVTLWRFVSVGVAQPCLKIPSNVLYPIFCRRVCLREAWSPVWRLPRYSSAMLSLSSCWWPFRSLSCSSSHSSCFTSTTLAPSYSSYCLSSSLEWPACVWASWSVPVRTELYPVSCILSAVSCQLYPVSCLLQLYHCYCVTTTQLVIQTYKLCNHNFNSFQSLISKKLCNSHW